MIAKDTYPPRLRIALEAKVTDLLARYSVYEVIDEIRRQRPALRFDIHPGTAPARKGAATATDCKLEQTTLHESTKTCE